MSWSNYNTLKTVVTIDECKFAFDFENFLVNHSVVIWLLTVSDSILIWLSVSSGMLFFTEHCICVWLNAF